MYFRVYCCTHDEVFGNCWNCDIDNYGDDEYEPCDVDCEYSDGNTISEDQLSCDCADVFYGDCCQYGTRWITFYLLSFEYEIVKSKTDIFYTIDIDDEHVLFLFAI